MEKKRETKYSQTIYKTIEYLKCKANLNFNINFESNGTIGTLTPHEILISLCFDSITFKIDTTIIPVPHFWHFIDNILNKGGPMTEPCRTPVTTGLIIDAIFPISTSCLRLLQQLSKYVLHCIL